MRYLAKLKRGAAHVILFVVMLMLVGASVTLLASEDLEDSRPIEFIAGLISTPCREINCPRPHNAIRFKTSKVELSAKDFHINVNGQNFLGNVDKSKLISTSPDKNHTTLEVEWSENGVPMALYMYFERNKKRWWVIEIRTFDGNPGAGWIYYDRIGGQQKLDKKLKIASLIHKNNNNPENTSTGEIHATKLKLEAFDD